MTQDIFIPSPLAERLMREAEQRGITVEEFLTNAVKNYINKTCKIKSSEKEKKNKKIFQAKKSKKA